MRSRWVAKMVYKLLHPKKSDCDFLFIKMLMLVVLQKVNITCYPVVMEDVSYTKLGAVNIEKN